MILWSVPVSRKWSWGVLDGLKAENGTHHSHKVFFFLKRCCFVVVLRRHHLHPSEVVQHPNLAYCHFSKEPVVVDGPIDHLGMPAEQHLPREFGFGTIHLKSAPRERRIYSQAAAIRSSSSFFICTTELSVHMVTKKKLKIHFTQEGSY